MGTTKIFLASSSELKNDRKEFREFLSVENDRLHQQGIYLEMVQWEHFLDAISSTSLQDEYNQALESCDIVVCLFYTKAGKYTLEEFETALKQFRDTGKPLIYTYFKTGAPTAAPDDESAQSLALFKDRLTEIGHFYTLYENISELKYKFGQQLRKLEDIGFAGLQQEIKEKTEISINQYFDQSITIQNVTDSNITLNVGGNQQVIEKKLDTLLEELKKLQVRDFKSAGKTYDIDTINEANFNYVVGQAMHGKNLPQSLVENLITDDTIWVNSLRQGLQTIVAVGNSPFSIFQHYGCLIEECLRKMVTNVGKDRKLRRLSFMAEVFQSSLRYLCFIQMAQILKLSDTPNHPLISNFLHLKEKEHLSFDYLNLLIISSDVLRDRAPFIPDINQFANELADTMSEVSGTALFLEKYRGMLVNGSIIEDQNFNILLDEYLTGLVSWLRRCSFLAKYRLVSIKDINLVYRLGTAKRFVHQYGELHGIYAAKDSYEYPNYSIKESFTYNQSVLLFNGNSVQDCLDSIEDSANFLSLSPLIIDQSVFSEKEAQTPEIYYYTGYDPSPAQYHFAHCRNELSFGEHKTMRSNKYIHIKNININQPKLDELFKQIERVFKPFKI